MFVFFYHDRIPKLNILKNIILSYLKLWRILSLNTPSSSSFAPHPPKTVSQVVSVYTRPDLTVAIGYSAAISGDVIQVLSSSACKTTLPYTSRCVCLCVCVCMSGSSCMSQEIAGAGLFAFGAQLAAAETFLKGHVLAPEFPPETPWRSSQT